MIIHTVKKGESVFGIASRYGVSPNRIISDNAIVNPKNLVVGQALLIVIPDKIYKSVRGDNVQKIAEKNGVSVATILQYNTMLGLDSPVAEGTNVIITAEGEKRREIYSNAYAYTYTSEAIIKKVLPYMTTLTLFGYGFNLDGTLIEPDDTAMIDLCFRYKVAPVMLLSSITDDGNFSSEKAGKLFSDKVLAEKVVDNILVALRKKGYFGLDVDFEYIAAEDKDNFLDFLRYLHDRLSPEGYFINTDLAPKTSGDQPGLLYESHDYRQIGEISDTVLLMTYEWGYTYGPPLAVAPANRVREVAQYAVSEINPQKIRLGIPNYGYDWPLPFERGQTKATTVGNEYAITLAARYGSEIKFDDVSKAPYFEYYAPDRVKHIVWFEDVRSYLAKYDIMDEFSLSGCGFWNASRRFTQGFLLLGVLYDIKKLLK